MVDAPPKTAPRLFLIDAYALIYRSFFAFVNRPLVSSRGENTSAAWGFTNFLLKIREEHQPDYMAVVFDSGTSQREEQYPEYKATREKMPDDLAESLPRLRALVDAFHDPVIEVEGYEADDVIGTLAAKARDQGLEAVIVSGDKDFHQLVGSGIHLLNPGRGGPTGVAEEWVDERNAADRFGLPPSQVVDYLALVGDSSDNIPGAPGVGPKTALSLLKRFGTLEEVLASVDEVPGKRARESLRENAEQVRLSKRLVTIQTDVPVELDLEELAVREPDRERLRELFIELEFRTLLDKVAPPGAGARTEGGGAPEYRLLETPDAVRELSHRARSTGRVALAVRGPGADPMRGSPVGVSLALEPGEAFYLPIGHRSAHELALDDGGEEPENLPPLTSGAMRSLVDVLEDGDVRKIGHDLKHDMVVLDRVGVALRGAWFDTTLASYVLDPGRRQHDVEALATDLFGLTLTSYRDVAGAGKSEISFAEVSVGAARDFTCQRADFALRLEGRFAPELEDHGLATLFHELEMPLVPVLARMELNGIRIDREFFRSMSRRLAQELELIEDEIFKLAGTEFNINSTPQLREILFDRMGLPVLKRTKTGPSTDVSVLEELAAEGHQIPQLLMEYRTLDKLRSTYVDALPRLVNPATGRIHTSFNQTVAATGRLSSSEPNLQNIPVRTDVGREIRKGFVADEGHLFVAADYSQVELRILAHFSGDDAFVRAFREGIDVHRQTASVIFDVPIEGVTSSMRAQAKTINFATLYGQGDFSLARQLGIGREEARRFIEEYFQRFAGVRSFLDEQVALAKERGYVETLSGRRRYIPELRSKNWSIRQFGERVAQNTPIQGTAADLIKRAMIDVQAALDDANSRAKLLLQVHDELLFEVPADEVEPVRRLVSQKMEGAMRLEVPLVVDVGVGRSWYEAKA